MSDKPRKSLDDSKIGVIAPIFEGSGEVGQLDKELSTPNLRLVRLVNICQGRDPREGINFLLSNHYTGFYVKVPDGFKAQFLKVLRKRHPQDLAQARGYYEPLIQPEYMRVTEECILQLLQHERITIEEFCNGALITLINNSDKSSKLTYREYGIGTLIPNTTDIAAMTPTTKMLSHESYVVKVLRDPGRRKAEKYVICGITTDDIYVLDGALSLKKNMNDSSDSDSPSESEEMVKAKLVNHGVQICTDRIEAVGEEQSCVNKNNREYMTSQASAQKAVKMKITSDSTDEEIEKELIERNLVIKDPLDLKNNCPAIFAIMKISQWRYICNLNDDSEDSGIKTKLRRENKEPSGKQSYRSQLGAQKRSEFVSKLTRANYESRSPFQWRDQIGNYIDDDPFINCDCYSELLQYILTASKFWLANERSNDALLLRLNAHGFRHGSTDSHLEMISRLITNWFIAKKYHFLIEEKRRSGGIIKMRNESFNS